MSGMRQEQGESAAAAAQEAGQAAAQAVATGGVASGVAASMVGSAPGAATAADGQTAATAGEAQAQRERQQLAEHNALARVFDDVRAQSAASQLVQPTRWEALGFVPQHLTAEDFEMFVYEYWEDRQAQLREQRQNQEQGQLQPASATRSATHAVGVAPDIQQELARQRAQEAVRAAATEGGESAPADAGALAQDGRAAAAGGQDGAAPAPVEPMAATPPSAQAAATASSASSRPVSQTGGVSPFEGLDIPAGYELTQLEGEWVLVPTDKDAPPIQLPIECDTVVALVGVHSYYLYDSALMTDTYAHWAFLAAEDNDVATFVECVREEGRVYPRPMPAESLQNAPFRMTAQRIADTWEAVQATGNYPDIQQCQASNGDAYYFSTNYLTREYATSLAEWESVERYMNV